MIKQDSSSLLKHFTSLQDVSSPLSLIQKGLDFKKNPLSQAHLGQGKTLGLIFFNPSLRTRLSTQKAGHNLGLSVIVMNVSSDGWKLETEEGVVMNGDTAEHIRDAAAVMGQYCDIIGLRAFASLQNREADYQEKILNAFKKYAGVPIVSLESATRHPLQSLADWMTIEEYKKKDRPKVVLTWAPHPKALPQAVANSFLEWMKASDYELLLTHPRGYHLAEEFAGDVEVEYSQKKAFENADFIYAKNWSSYQDYGKASIQDLQWTVDAEKMQLTQEAYLMHCLPVRRNVVVSDAVLDSPQSLILPQAQNRVFSAQAVLAEILASL